MNFTDDEQHKIVSKIHAMGFKNAENPRKANEIIRRNKCFMFLPTSFF